MKTYRVTFTSMKSPETVKADSFTDGAGDSVTFRDEHSIAIAYFSGVQSVFVIGEQNQPAETFSVINTKGQESATPPVTFGEPIPINPETHDKPYDQS